MSKWDARMMVLAGLVSTWSKDPSTQAGCVIVRPDRTVASLGYNGFPRGVDDLSRRLTDRVVKYPMTVHAETNAVVAAREALHGYTAYVYPFPPCAPCVGVLIQAGIVRVVAPPPKEEQKERWGISWELAITMADEAGMEWVYHE